MKIYGQSTPPEYNLNKTMVPVAVLSGLDDILISPKVSSQHFG